MLKLDYVVINFEGFKHKNETYLIKEISVFGPSDQDTLPLKPQCHIDQVPADTRRTYLWCSKHLHGQDWNSGSHDYSFIYKFFTSLKIRFPNTVLYAKGEAKCSYLRSHLFNTVDLESVGCPKVTDFVIFENTICTKHIHPEYFEIAEIAGHNDLKKVVIQLTSEEYICLKAALLSLDTVFNYTATFKSNHAKPTIAKLDERKKYSSFSTTQ